MRGSAWALATLWFLAASQVSAGDYAPAKVLDVQATVEGQGYKELSARWWQWVNSFPGDVVPYQDPDGRWCTYNQSGPVWFLAGTDGNHDFRRHCIIPSKRHVFLPIINMYVQNRGTIADKRVCAQLHRAAAVNNDALRSAVVLIDGEPVSHPERYRVRSDCFDPFATGKPASGVVAASDGYWLLLPPLTPGRHLISVGANYGADVDHGFGRMVQNFEYELEIGGPSI